MNKEGLTSINAYVDMALNYLHHGRITMCYNNLLSAKKVLDELDTMANSQNLRTSEYYHKSASTN